jgi:Uma2 family endonuclease
MSPTPNKQLTFDEYVEFEMASPVHHEFVGGHVYALAGASKRHHRILSSLHLRIGPALGDGPCLAFLAGVKLQVGKDIYYPDLMVACSPSDSDELIAREPCLIVEITSPSTARFDRTEKLLAYRNIPTLKTYLVIEQAWRRVVRHWRDASGSWLQKNLESDGSIALPCPEISLTLDQIYQGLAPLTVKEMEAIGYGVEEINA